MKPFLNWYVGCGLGGVEGVDGVDGVDGVEDDG